jgi:hypothetical protein
MKGWEQDRIGRPPLILRSGTPKSCARLVPRCVIGGGPNSLEVTILIGWMQPRY